MAEIIEINEKTWRIEEGMVRFLHYQFPYAGFFGELRGTYAI